MEIQTILQNFGLSQKEIAVYSSLIELGPSPVRLLSQKSKVNRGTTYDILKSLMSEGLVTYFNKQTKQYFVAESPQKLINAIVSKQQQLAEVQKDIESNLPELQALFEREGGRPQVKLYEGMKGIRQILEDVLAIMSEVANKTYYVYSSSSLRENVFQAMPEFTKKRIARKIRVHSIAIGDGGQLVGLDERKWLPESKGIESTYEIIYSNKVAHISLDSAAEPVGVIIDNESIYETQKVIFETLWEKL